MTMAMTSGKTSLPRQSLPPYVMHTATMCRKGNRGLPRYEYFSPANRIWFLGFRQKAGRGRTMALFESTWFPSSR